MFCADSAADHDSYGSSQSESARTGDDQHADAPGDGPAGIPAHEHPYDDGQQRQTYDSRDEDGGHLVGDPRQRSLRSRGIGDHPDYLGKCGILSDSRRSAPDISGLIDGSRGYTVALSLVHRDRLACQRGFVDRGMPLEDDAVYRNIFTGLYDEDIADRDLIDADHGLLAVPQYGRLLGSELHQALERVRGATLGHRLQHLADGDERRYHRCRLEVQMVHRIVCDLLVIAQSHIPDHEKERDQ